VTLLRAMISFGLGMMWALMIFNTFIPELPMFFHVIGIVTASFLTVAVPIDRSRASKEIIDTLRKGMEHFYGSS
jgi:MFS superfamily sulfate permease-like transporter